MSPKKAKMPIFEIHRKADGALVVDEQSQEKIDNYTRHDKTKLNLSGFQWCKKRKRYEATVDAFGGPKKVARSIKKASKDHRFGYVLINDDTNPPPNDGENRMAKKTKSKGAATLEDLVVQTQEQLKVFAKQSSDMASTIGNIEEAFRGLVVMLSEANISEAPEPKKGKGKGKGKSKKDPEPEPEPEPKKGKGRGKKAKKDEDTEPEPEPKKGKKGRGKSKKEEPKPEPKKGKKAAKKDDDDDDDWGADDWDDENPSDDEDDDDDTNDDDDDADDEDDDDDNDDDDDSDDDDDDWDDWDD